MNQSIDVVLSGSGLTHPKDVVTNEELVKCFNSYVQHYNHEHAKEIAEGEIEALKESAVDFIVKASGIKQRYARDKKNFLDPNVMWQFFKEGSDDELSLQAAEGLTAAKEALKNANKNPEDIDAVILSCSHKQRDYPSVSIEIQNALGIKGFAFDMGVACSSATFAIQMAVDTIRAGHAKAVLVISPEISLGKVNFRDRDSHFIFGEATTAVVIERADGCKAKDAFKILETHLQTNFSNAVRNNSGAYDRSSPETFNSPKKMFYQEGRKVFKEVTPMVIQEILTQLAKYRLTPADVKRFWLHQANANMNRFICEKLLGEDYDPVRAPVVLDEFGNSAAAGSIIAYHRHHDNINSGEYTVLCSFGAGYSIGCILLQKV